LTSLIVVIIIYVAIVAIVIGAIQGIESPGTSWKMIGSHGELAMVEAARKFMGPLGFIIMIVGGLVSTVSALNATIFSSSRVSFAMGRDGTLPESLGKINKVRRTPSNAIALSGLILIVMAVALPIEDVAASASIMFLMLFSFANISLITLRRKMPYLQRGFVVPFVPILPIVATCFNIALAVYLFQDSPVSWYIAIAWIEFGLIGYYFTRGKEEISDLEKIEKMVGVAKRDTGKEYHVLVPIANPNNTELIDFASSVTKHRDGDMILLNIAAIPDTIPIQNVDYDFVNRRAKIAEELSEYSTKTHNVITRARVVVSHKIRDTILETVNKEKADITFLGWSDKPPRSRILFGYNIDDIIQYAKSDVVILKGPIKGDVNNILVLPGFHHHGDRVAELSAYMARDKNAKVVILGLVTPDKTETGVKTETRHFADITRSFGVEVEELVIKTKRPVQKIIKLSKDYDFMLIGAGERWKLLRYAFGPIPDSVARKLEIPFLLLRAYGKEEKMISTSQLGEDKDEESKEEKKDEVVGVATPIPDEKLDLPQPVPTPTPVPVPVEKEEAVPDEEEKSISDDTATGADTVSEETKEDEGKPGEVDDGDEADYDEDEEIEGAVSESGDDTGTKPDGKKDSDSDTNEQEVPRDGHSPEEGDKKSGETDTAESVPEELKDDEAEDAKDEEDAEEQNKKQTESEGTGSDGHKIDNDKERSQGGD
jgi:nucleotide-binding universal stress UspA family protein